jgi:hypothetical protein
MRLPHPIKRPTKGKFPRAGTSHKQELCQRAEASKMLRQYDDSPVEDLEGVSDEQSESGQKD